NSIVCYCYRKTVRDLKEAYATCGSLKGVEDATRAGTACSGCKVILQSLFGEAPSDANAPFMETTVGTSCSKPGRRIMKGFFIHDENLHSKVFSSNAVAPQLGNCDTTTEAEYTLVDHKGY